MAAVVKWLTHWIVAPARVGSIPTGRPIISQGYSSIGRATVSKTVGCRFKSYCSCQSCVVSKKPHRNVPQCTNQSVYRLYSDMIGVEMIR